MKIRALQIILATIIFSNIASGQVTTYKPSLVAQPIYFDISPPLRDMALSPPRKVDHTWKDGVVKNFFDVRKDRKKEIFKAGYIDPVIQDFAGMAPLDTTLQNFDGNANASGAVPPDTHGDVGPNHYFQVVNLSYAIYNKSGTILLGPALNSTIFSGLPNNVNDGDAVVLYDEQADRWLFSQFSLPSYPNGPFYQMIAVSQTPDPTGSWYRWEYSFTDMPDYPKFGVWPDGYYMSCNRFTAGAGNWNGIGAVAYNRTAMLAGNASPQMVMFTLSASNEAYSILPADCDGPFPPSGTPNYFMYMYDASPYHLGIYEFHVDWVTAANSTFSNYQGLTVNTFNSTLAGIPQPGTTTQLDPITDRLMYRLQYRKFSDHASMVCNHTVNAGSSVAGIRWYELRKTTGSWSVYQQATYSPNSTGRWMGSIAMDTSGNIAMGYSVSSSSVYPSIRYTGRLSADGLNQMTFTEKGIINGGGSQTGTWSGRSRWGDYSALSTDPSQPGKFWYTQEYYSSTSTSGWKTRIASFSLGAVPLSADFNADTLNPHVGSTVSFTDLSVGTPTGWAWSFSPSSVTYTGGTNSSSRNPKVIFTVNGPYTVTLTSTTATSSNTKIKAGYIHAGTPGLWTGITSSDWNTASNWHNYLVPTNAGDAVIPSSATNWPQVSGDLTIGTSCQDLFISASSTITTSGNLNINAGSSLNFTGPGTLKVGGDWNDSGTFNCGNGTVEFFGPTAAKITSGLNPWTYIVNYARSTFAPGMTTITGGTAGPTGDDGAKRNVSIGFSFNYLGTNYSQIQITTNGCISFNAGTNYAITYINDYLFTTTTPSLVLAPWWDDLYADGTSAITYKLDGSTPNRVFTVQFLHLLTYSTGVTARINFQVKLYETTNVFEFCYGTVEAGTHDAAESASIGIKDATGGTNHFIDATTGSFTSGLINLVSTGNWPVVNYRFTPASSVETFYNLKENKTSSTLTIQPNIKVNGNVLLGP
jgi:PKD repeat protein